MVAELKLEHFCGRNVGTRDGHHFHQLVINGWSIELLQGYAGTIELTYTCVHYRSAKQDTPKSKPAVYSLMATPSVLPH